MALVAAGFGLLVTAGLFYGAIKFYRTIHEMTKNNPSLVTPHDTLRINPSADTLLDHIAGLNQQIAEKLSHQPNKVQEQKLIILNNTMTNLVFVLDSLKETGSHDQTVLLTLKNAINKTNLEFRAALFDVNEVANIPGLESFMILNENKLENTIFECFLKKETQCFDSIKHQALYLEWLILEKNFSQLKT